MNKNVQDSLIKNIYDTQRTHGHDELIRIFSIVYFNAGLQDAISGKYDNAISWLEESAVLMPNCPQPLMLMAKITLYKGQLEQCERYLERASSKSNVDQRQIKSLRNAIKNSLKRQIRNEYLAEKYYAFIKKTKEIIFWSDDSKGTHKRPISISILVSGAGLVLLLSITVFLIVILQLIIFAKMDAKQPEAPVPQSVQDDKSNDPPGKDATNLSGNATEAIAPKPNEAGVSFNRGSDLVQSGDHTEE